MWLGLTISEKSSHARDAEPEGRGTYGHAASRPTPLLTGRRAAGRGTDAPDAGQLPRAAQAGGHGPLPSLGGELVGGEATDPIRQLGSVLRSSGDPAE